MPDIASCVNSVFEQPRWLDIVAPGHWGESIVKENGEVVARLPYVLKNNKILMPPMTQTLGPWIKPEHRANQKGNVQLHRQKEIIFDLISQLPHHGSFDMIFDSSNKYILPYRWLGFVFEPTFSYRICALNDLDAIYCNFNKTVLKNIKTAKNKVEIIDSNDVADLLELMRLTYRQQKRTLPDDEKLIKEIFNRTIEHGFGKLFVAIDMEGNKHSCAFLLYDSNVCYYLMGGSNAEFRSGGAQSLILWHSIRFAASVSRMFDFEGSMVEGIENFFRQFGGAQIINYRVKKQSLLGDFCDICKPRIKKLIRYKN